jgi:hypothetical protein
MLKAGTDERKTVLKTIRISDSLASSLQQEAADEGTTVNADINSILNRHFTWDKKVKEFGFVTIPKLTFMSVIDGLDDETLARIGRQVVPAMFEEMAQLWFQESTPEKILEAISTRFKFDALIRVSISKEEDLYTVVLRHDLGPKWSILSESAARELVKRFLHAEPQVSRGESVVTVRFKLKPRISPSDRNKT